MLDQNKIVVDIRKAAAQLGLDRERVERLLVSIAQPSEHGEAEDVREVAHCVTIRDVVMN